MPELKNILQKWPDPAPGNCKNDIMRAIVDNIFIWHICCRFFVRNRNPKGWRNKTKLMMLNK